MPLRWNSGRWRLTPWLALAMQATVASLAAGLDFSVLLGPNAAGSWSVSVDSANPQPSAAVVLIDLVPESTVQPICNVGCLPPTMSIAPLGSESLDAALHMWSGSVFTFYLSGFSGTQAGLPLPAMRVRMVDRANPIRSVDVPIVSLSRLASVNPSTLNFAGVTLNGTAHTNLVLGNVQRTDSPLGDELPLTLELFGSDGNLLASSTLMLTYGKTTLIGNIVSYLGATPLPLGQLRITRTGGNALMWGILYTQDSNGAITASVGANLSQ